MKKYFLGIAIFSLIFVTSSEGSASFLQNFVNQFAGSAQTQQKNVAQISQNSPGNVGTQFLTTSNTQPNQPLLTQQSQQNQLMPMQQSIVPLSPQSQGVPQQPQFGALQSQTVVPQPQMQGQMMPQTSQMTQQPPHVTQTTQPQPTVTPEVTPKKKGFLNRLAGGAKKLAQGATQGAIYGASTSVPRVLPQAPVMTPYGIYGGYNGGTVMPNASPYPMGNGTYSSGGNIALPNAPLNTLASGAQNLLHGALHGATQGTLATATGMLPQPPVMIPPYSTGYGYNGGINMPGFYPYPMGNGTYSNGGNITLPNAPLNTLTSGVQNLLHGALQGATQGVLSTTTGLLPQAPFIASVGGYPNTTIPGMCIGAGISGTGVTGYAGSPSPLPYGTYPNGVNTITGMPYGQMGQGLGSSPSFSCSRCMEPQFNLMSGGQCQYYCQSDYKLEHDPLLNKLDKKYEYKSNQSYGYGPDPLEYRYARPYPPSDYPSSYGTSYSYGQGDSYRGLQPPTQSYRTYSPYDPSGYQSNMGSTPHSSPYGDRNFSQPYGNGGQPYGSYNQNRGQVSPYGSPYGGSQFTGNYTNQPY